MKNIYGFLFHKRWVIWFFLKEIDKFCIILIYCGHWLDVLEIERVLQLLFSIILLNHSHTIMHVGIVWYESICCCVRWRVVSVCDVVSHYTIAVTRTACWVCSYFDALIFYFLKIHLFRSIICCRISLAYPICLIPVSIIRVLQI